MITSVSVVLLFVGDSLAEGMSKTEKKSETSQTSKSETDNEVTRETVAEEVADKSPVGVAEEDLEVIEV